MRQFVAFVQHQPVGFVEQHPGGGLWFCERGVRVLA